MTDIYLHGTGLLKPAPGARRIEKYGDEGDAKTKRLPRVDRMSVAVAKEALGASGVEGLGLVVGTGYGGLQATVDFLEGVSVRGPAFGSPTAFHESVHHAPAGQISIILGITGISLTASARELSGEASLKEGCDLLRQGRAKRVLVVCADEVVPALEAAFRAFTTQWVPAEGAAAVVLSTEPSKVKLHELTLRAHPVPTLRFNQAPAAGELNPSGGLLRIVEAARELAAAAAGAVVRVHTNALGGGESMTVLQRQAT